MNKYLFSFVLGRNEYIPQQEIPIFTTINDLLKFIQKIIEKLECDDITFNPHINKFNIDSYTICLIDTEPEEYTNQYTEVTKICTPKDAFFNYDFYSIPRIENIILKELNNLGEELSNYYKKEK